jgi:hypothetical protein
MMLVAHDTGDHEVSQKNDEIRLFSIGRGDDFCEIRKGATRRTDMEVGQDRDFHAGLRCMPRRSDDRLLNDSKTRWLPPKAPGADDDDDQNRDCEESFEFPSG